MGKVVVITDSTCDLSKKLIEENDIKIVPLYVNFDDAIYKDGVEITSEKLYELVDERGNFQKHLLVQLVILLPYLNNI